MANRNCWSKTQDPTRFSWNWSNGSKRSMASREAWKLSSAARAGLPVKRWRGLAKSMAFQVEISPLALVDIDEAYLWLYEQSPLAAARWFRGLRKAIDSLETNPARCSLAPESDVFAQELRQLFYGRRRGIYRILFTVAGNTVRVHRIRHGSSRFLKPG